MSTPTTSRFLRLPGEIRNRIYEFVVEPDTWAENCDHHNSYRDEDGEVVEQKCHHDRPGYHAEEGERITPQFVPALAQVCRATRTEFLPLHRSTTNWHVCIGDLVEEDHCYSVINRVFGFNRVPQSITASWEGTIKVHVPQMGYGASQPKHTVTSLLHFLGTAPGIKVEFLAPRRLARGGGYTPIPLLTAFFSRSNPSFAQYVAMNRDAIWAVHVTVDWLNRDDLACTVEFHKSRIPAWLRKLIAYVYDGGALKVSCRKDSIRPHITSMGLMLPWIENIVEVCVLSSVVMPSFSYNVYNDNGRRIKYI